jgi:signal transduction histidine kinase
MKIRGRVIALISFIAFVMISVGTIRLVQINAEFELAKTNQLAEREAGAVSSIVKVVQSRYQAQLMDEIEREESARHMGLSPVLEESLDRHLAAGPFLAVALLKSQAQEKWQTAWTRERKDLSTRWPSGFLNQFIQGLPLESVAGDVTHWSRAEDDRKQSLFVMIRSVKAASGASVVVGVLPMTAFQEVTEAFVATGDEMLVVDDRGYAMAFSDQAYVGAAVTPSHKVVEEILRRREVQYKISGTDRLGRAREYVAKRIPETNLFAITGISAPSKWAVAPRILWTLLIVGVALMLIGLGYIQLLGRAIEDSLDYLKHQLENIALGKPVNYFAGENSIMTALKPTIDRLVGKAGGEAPQYIKEATGERVDAEKMGAYREISLGLAQALKEPLATVLGQAQLARSKSAGNEGVKEHFVVIERETRRARDTLDNLLRMGGQGEFSNVQLDLRDVILAALNAQKGLLNSQNVKVNKELNEAVFIQGNATQLQTAMEEIIKNAVEAMARSPERSLRVATEMEDDHILVKITDSGSGLDENQMSKVFDPFFTSKSGDEHKGLGLTVAKGIVKAMKGAIRIHSDGVEHGTTVVIEFPSGRRSDDEVGLTLASSSGDIAKPLNGSRADELPAPPALDEITLIDLQAPEPAAMGIRPPKVKEQ